MKFGEIVRKRYAVKSFDGEKVSGDLIPEFLELIRLAPSSFNMQPWKIKVIEDAETKEKLLPHSWNQPQVTSCSHLLVFCADTDLDALIEELDQLMKDGGIPDKRREGFMGMVRPFFKDMPYETRLSWAQRQVYIALSNAMNAATSLGFDACPMEGITPEKYNEILGLPNHLVTTVALPIGYATDEAPEKLRFSNDQIFL